MSASKIRISTLFLLVNSFSANANRQIEMVPLTVSANWTIDPPSPSAGPTSVNGNNALNLKNISGTNQSIDVSITNEVLTVGTCNNSLSSLSGWISTSPLCAYSSHHSDAYTQTIALSAHSSAIVGIGIYCNITTSGLSSCTRATSPSPTTPFPYKVTPSYSLEISLNVTPDPGAILASLIMGTNTGNLESTGQVFNFPFNGGRPF